MRTRIKVCCIQSVEEARLAIAEGVDALGLVSVMPSGPGPIPEDRIREIAASIPPPVGSFLLTAETTAAAISAQIRRTSPTAVQVVSHIAEQEAAALAAREPWVRRIQVIHVEDANCLQLISRYAPHVHAFLLDSGRPGADTPELGGTGRVHDWGISCEFVRRSPVPVFLAGGLQPDNVAEAIRQVRPFGLDICSGLRHGGALNAELLRRLVKAVHEADTART